jgi:hypothetical protein
MGREEGLSLPATLLGLLLAPIIAAWLVLYGALALIWGTTLRLWFWRAHRRHGRHVLFVYSQSPTWQAYIEANILPRLRDRAVVLDWSQRKQWNGMRLWWEARVFEHWAGTREFNPIAIVFATSTDVVCIRFFRAFRAFTNGQPEALREAEAELETWL